MNLFDLNLYLIRIPRKWKYKVEFCDYLKLKLKEIINIRLETFLKDNPLKDNLIEIKSYEVPSFVVSGDKSKILESSYPTDELPSPEKEECITLSYDIYWLVNTLIDQCSYFRVTLESGDTAEYFGIQQDQIFQDTPVLADFIMRALDFGTADTRALNLFLPEFSELRENLEIYYNVFLSWREKNVNTGKL